MLTNIWRSFCDWWRIAFVSPFAIYNGVARIFVWGGATRYIFRHLSGEPTAFSGGGGSSRSFPWNRLPDHIQWGGVVAEIFHVHKSIAFPRFRHIFATFSGQRRLLTTLTGIKAHFPGLLINSFQKKTFTRSLGGPWPPWPPPWLRHWPYIRHYLANLPRLYIFYIRKDIRHSVRPA